MTEWVTIEGTHIGKSHESSGKPNQDATAATGQIGAVSDGHGSSAHPYSEIGSSFAVKCALEVLENWMNNLGRMDDEEAFVSPKLDENTFLDKMRLTAYEALPNEIVRRWRERVLEHWCEANIPEEMTYRAVSDHLLSDDIIYRMYGCTLMAVAIFHEYMLCLQIGDGLITAYKYGGEIWHPIPRDLRHTDNQTTSLSERYAPLNFKINFVKLDGTVEFVALTTDGVENAYPQSSDDYIYFFHSVHGMIVEDALNLSQLLEKTSHYSGDDSTALIITRNNHGSGFEQLSEITEVFREDMACKEGFIPAVNWLMDASSSKFWIVMQSICNRFMRLLEQNKAVTRTVLQDIRIHMDTYEAELYRPIIKPLTSESEMESLKCLERLLKEIGNLAGIDVSEAWKREIKQSSKKEMTSFHQVIKWIHQVRETLKFDYEKGGYTLENNIRRGLIMETPSGAYTLFHDDVVFIHQIINGVCTAVVGEIKRHPKNPQIWGLKNLSNHEWVQYRKGEKEPLYIGRGKTALLSEGTFFIYGLPVHIKYE